MLYTDVQAPGAPPPLPVARGGGGNAVYNRGKCYLFGGESIGEKINPAVKMNEYGIYWRVDIYDMKSNTWSVGKVC